MIASANANADVVTSVIVGNETLLRKEVTAAQLVKLIHKVKSQIKQPVTYADVWSSGCNTRKLPRRWIS